MVTKEQGKIVLDWDGTVTDINSRAETYIDPFINLAAKEINVNESELKEMMNSATQVVHKYPDKYSWEWKGVPTSAPTDTFLIHQSALRIVLKQLTGKPSFNSAENDLIVKLHEHGRSMMDLVSQPGVGEFIDS